jgi:hypothetical protein
VVDASITCPACGKEQNKSAECRSCGVVFSRYGEARSLFTARRTPTRGPRSPRGTLRDALDPGWLMVALAVGIGVVLGRASVEPPTPAPSPRVADAADVEPSSPVEFTERVESPGLSAAQLRYGLDLTDWNADGSVPQEPIETDESEPDEPEVDAPTAAAPEPPAAPTPVPGASVRGLPGESTSPLADRTTSPNSRFDPVGTRGWYEGFAGYERALQERDKRDRTLVVYFHAPWCEWCARFRRDYLSHADLRDFLDDTIRVHIDGENSDEEAELATYFGVRAFPSFFVVPAGTERPERLHPFLGDVELDPESFARLCRHVAEGRTFTEPRVLGGRGVVPFGFGG